MRNRTISLWAVAAIAVTVTALWFTNRAVTPKTPTWDDVVAEAEVGGYKLINTKELAKVYQENKPGLLLVDTRQEWEYRAGHIMGAALFPMEPTAWARWKKKDALAAFLGPDKDRTLIFY